MEFKDKCREIRERYGLNRKDMSLVCGLGINSWANYERGEKPSRSIAAFIILIRDPYAMRFLLDILPSEDKDYLGKKYERCYNLVLERQQTIKVTLDMHRHELVTTGKGIEYKTN